MGLLRVQEALAAILMEPDARKDFAQDPRGALRRRGLRGRDLEFLATLAPDDLAYFAERRDIDRHHALRADAPISVRLLEAANGRLTAYVRAFPYALEDPRKEAERFARWAKAAAREGIVPAVLPDVAAVEAATLRLLGVQARTAKPSGRPRRAPGVRVLRLGHAVGPVLRGAGAAKAKAGPSWLALQRTADDVRWASLTPLQAHLLRTATGRLAQAAWLRGGVAAIPGARASDARKAEKDLRDDGLLAPAR